jgi:hypothetical protein
LEHHIIPAKPNGPAHSRYTKKHTFPLLAKKTLNPPLRNVIYTCCFLNIKGNTYCTPHQPGYRAFKEKVLNCLLHITEATSKTSLPPPFGQVIFSKDHTLPQNQRKIFVFKGTLTFEDNTSKGTPTLNMISLYIDLTEKVLLPFQIKVPLCVLSLTPKRPTSHPLTQTI